MMAIAAISDFLLIRLDQKCGKGNISDGFICHKNGVQGYQGQLKTARKTGNTSRVKNLKKLITKNVEPKKSEAKGGSRKGRNVSNSLTSDEIFELNKKRGRLKRKADALFKQGARRDIPTDEANAAWEKEDELREEIRDIDRTLKTSKDSDAAKTAEKIRKRRIKKEYAGYKSAKKEVKRNSEEFRKAEPVQAALASVKDGPIQANLRRRIEQFSKNGKISPSDLDRAFNAVGGSAQYKNEVTAELRKAGLISRAATSTDRESRLAAAKARRTARVARVRQLEEEARKSRRDDAPLLNVVNLDARKVASSSGKIPGKRCKNSYISASFNCSTHRGPDGKLTEEGKASARELAAKVRTMRGLKGSGGSLAGSKAANLKKKFDELDKDPKAKAFIQQYIGKKQSDKKLREALEFSQEELLVTADKVFKKLGIPPTVDRRKVLKNALETAYGGNRKEIETQITNLEGDLKKDNIPAPVKVAARKELTRLRSQLREQERARPDLKVIEGGKQSPKQPPRNLTKEYDSKIEDIRKIKDPQKRYNAAQALQAEARRASAPYSRDSFKGIRNKISGLVTSTRQSAGRKEGTRPTRENAPYQVPTNKAPTRVRGPGGRYYSIDAQDYDRGDGQECGASHIPDSHTCHVGKGKSKSPNVSRLNRPNKADIGAERIAQAIFARRNEYPAGKQDRFWARYKEDTIPLVKKHGKNWGIKAIESFLELDDLEKEIAKGNPDADKFKATLDLTRRGLAQVNRDRLNLLLTPKADPSFKQESDRIMSIKENRGTADKPPYRNLPDSKTIFSSYLKDFEISDDNSATIYRSEFSDFVKENPSNWGKKFLESQLEVSSSLSGRLMRAGMSDLSETEARRMIGARVKRSRSDSLISRVDAKKPKAKGDEDKKKKTKRSAKIAKVLGEFKSGKLKSSSGDTVTNRRQALAIALSEARRMG